MGWHRLMKPKWILLGLTLLAVNGGLAMFARRMYPVKRCTGADFWRAVCGVNVGTNGKDDPDGGFGGMLHPRRDGLCIYGEMGFHEEFLHSVPEAEALALFPKVRKELDRQLAQRQAPTTALHAYREWTAHTADTSDAWGLLDQIRAQRIEQWRRQDASMYRYVLQDERAFDARWEHIRRYPLNVAFEFIFLNALVVFAFWPWLRDLNAWRGIAHIASLPILLLLPCFLGYASWSFTSIGPSGGVLYPWLIVWFRAIQVNMGMSHVVDRIIWTYVPKPLGWLSQPTGPWLSISGGAGGVAVAVICLSALAWIACAALWFTLRHPGKRSAAGPVARACLNRRFALRAVLLALFAGAALGGTIFLLRLRLPVAFALVDEGATSDVCAILRTRPALTHQRGPGGLTLLHYAARHGADEVVNLLLDEESPVNAGDDDGLTPLHYAARRSDEEVAELLLKRGADVGARDKLGRTPLHQAAESEESTTRLLLAHGADAQARDDDGRTPLHDTRSKAVAEILLDSSADVNARDNWGDTPLLKRDIVDDEELAEFLIARGADVNARSTDGLTPLHIAARSGDEAVQEILLAHGAEVNARTVDGFTPLGLIPLRWDAKNYAPLLKHGGVR